MGTNYISEEPKHLVITNAMGTVVSKKELSNSTYQNTIEIGHLTSGAYIVEIRQKGNSQKAKFIKQ